MKRVVALLIALVMVLSVMPVAFAADELDTIVVSELIYRYDKNMAENDFSKGVGEVTDIFIWTDYLFATVNFNDECPGAELADRSAVLVYNLKSQTPQLLGTWNKTDLGIPIRNYTNANKEDRLMGIFVTDDNIYLETCMRDIPSAGSRRTGLYMYKNPFPSTSFEKPTPIELTPIDSKAQCFMLNSGAHYELNSGGMRNGYRLNLYPGIGDEPDILISTYGSQTIGNWGKLTVTTIPKDGGAATNNYIDTKALLSYEEGGITVEPSKILDTVFDGDRAYILGATNQAGKVDIVNSAGATKPVTMALWTISFVNPSNPVLDNVYTFDGDFPFETGKLSDGTSSGLNNNYTSKFEGGLTLKDGYAYVSTNFEFGSYFKEKCPHIFVLKMENGTFDLVSEIDLTDANRGAGRGFSEVQVFGNILVGVPATGTGTPATFLLLSDDRTEVLDYRLTDGGVTNKNYAFSRKSVSYGHKAIFAGITTLNYKAGSADRNKATIDVIDVFGAVGDWEADLTKTANTSFDNLFAKFDNEYVHSGVNTLRLTGTNTSAEPMDITVLLGFYKDGILEKTAVGNKVTVEAGGEIDVSKDIDLTGVDVNSGVLKAYLWKDTDTAIPIAQAVSKKEIPFTFEITEAATTSAGVYDENGKLVREIWNSLPLEPGVYTKSWDGLDYFGRAAVDGRYTIKVLTHNVEYEKLNGVIGNSSDCSGWETFISSYNSIFDMAVDKENGRIYYCSDHVEGGYGFRYLNLGNYKTNGGLLKANGGNNTATHSATDGELMYWGVSEPTIYRADTKDSNGNVVLPGSQISAFVFATENKLNNKGLEGPKYEFEYGELAVSKWNGKSIYSHSLNVTVTQNQYYNRIGGLEVQQDGNYLISAFRDAGKVYVNHKKTGQQISSLTLTEPSAMAMSRGGGSFDNYIYIAYKKDTSADNGFAVAKYTINSNGTLTKTADVITGHKVILGMALSPDGKTLAVVQGGDEDKLFIYNTDDYSLRMTYGSGASYYTDPTVYDDKFMFDDKVFDYHKEPYEHSFAEFTDNDSVFVGDSGNTRVFLFDVSGSAAEIEDMISFQSNSYNNFVVQGEEDRIFSVRKEYSVDYDKLEEYVANRSLEAFDDVWKLERNYLLYMHETHPSLGDDMSTTFARAFKMGDYTYFKMRNWDEKKDYLYKQDDSGLFTNTGIDMTGKDIHPDGTIWYASWIGNICRFYRVELASIGADGTPVYGEPQLCATIDYRYNERIPTQSDTFIAVTDSEKLIVLNASDRNIDEMDGKYMNLGAIDVSGEAETDFEWLAAPRILRRNANDFPKDGYFAMDSTMQYSAKYALAYNDSVIFHYRGEGYKGAQANAFYHFSDEGLLITVFGGGNRGWGEGYTASGGSTLQAQPCNSFSTSIAQSPNDTDVAYIYQNTEGAAGGVHITRVTGLDSIGYLEDIPITLNNGFVSGVAYTCFGNLEFDNTKVVAKGVSNNFAISFIGDTDNAERSVRFEGYFKPDTSGANYFIAKTDGKVSINIDGREVINGVGDSSAMYYMETNRLYKFIIEVAPDSNGNLSYFDMGYLSGEEYVDIDDRYMSCYAPETREDATINLLEGFLYHSDFRDGRYGWKTEVYNTATGPNAEETQIIMNKWNYRYDEIPDIYVKNYIYQGNSRELTRNLGDINSSDWRINVGFRMEDVVSRSLRPSYLRPGDGSAIEIVDKNGKVIAYFNVYANYNNEQMAAMSNEKELARFNKGYFNGDRVDGKVSSTGLARPQSWVVEAAENNQVKITYTSPSGEVITEYADASEPGADITAPSEVRFVAYNNYAWYHTCVWNILSLEVTPGNNSTK